MTAIFLNNCTILHQLRGRDGISQGGTGIFLPDRAATPPRTHSVDILNNFRPLVKERPPALLHRKTPKWYHIVCSRSSPSRLINPNHSQRAERALAFCYSYSPFYITRTGGGGGQDGGSGQVTTFWDVEVRKDALVWNWFLRIEELDIYHKYLQRGNFEDMDNS